ncbi:WXG100 family type VII secretion target [Myceligenerans indicum]|uniref:ESAT-6-like protein n=1 Tax=Myceligenerans indicum TaxID=2593663 RepID=A0ABS1LR98_9MICO|nr:WXG100 family type VII secretion target [Myceligenerans indicum]MBL0888811.1 WXG100 family type VII secretion target [Myceligenerans indicum]
MKYQVDSDQIEAASGAVAGSVATVRTEVAALMRNLDALQGTWTGGAATAFAGSVTQWRSAQAQVENALDAIQVALTQTARAYADAELTATRMFS